MTASIASYTALAMAILCEVAGSTLLQKSEQFTRPLPTLGMTALYVAAFYFLSQAIKGIPLGIAYAIWGGIGIILTTLISVFHFRHAIDVPALVGIALIVAGVVVMQVFSQATTH